MKFKTWEEMYRYLENEGDLYNPLLELYVFLYNEAGALCTYNISEEKATEILSQEEVKAVADVKMGSESATAWGCDLTYDYVKINADYRS